MPDFVPDFTGYDLDQHGYDWYATHKFVAQTPSEALKMVNCQTDNVCLDRPIVQTCIKYSTNKYQYRYVGLKYKYQYQWSKYKYHYVTFKYKYQYQWSKYKQKYHYITFKYNTSTNTSGTSKSICTFT